jgi:hypothetical protein
MEINEETGLPIGKSSKNAKKKCRNDFRHFQFIFEIKIKE